MNSTRLKVLLGVATGLIVLLIWNWISSWGLITLRVQSQPLSKVIRTIEHQGGIKLVTNADLSTPISMNVERVPVVAAIDELAARLDGSWTIGYVAGPSKAEVVSAIASISQNEPDKEFHTFGWGFGSSMMEGASTPIDVRKVIWKVSVSENPQLHSYLNQLCIKTGLMAIVPETWNPPIPKTPKTGKTAALAMREIIKSVKGASQEIFIIRVFDREQFAENRNRQEQPGRPPSEGGFDRTRATEAGDQRWGRRSDFKPEWIAERTEARIAQLPETEREQARKDFEEMRAFMEKTRTLPEAERRAAIEQLLSSPAMQERMAEHQALRDEKSGPERRTERARRYIERKLQMKKNPSSSL